jgi:hypothetical protein
MKESQDEMEASNIIATTATKDGMKESQDEMEASSIHGNL